MNKIGDKLLCNTDVGILWNHGRCNNIFFKRDKIYTIINIIKDEVFIDKLECGYIDYPIKDHQIQRFFTNIRVERKRKLNKLNER